MKKTVLLLLSLVCGVAFAHNSPNEMKAIDDKINPERIFYTNEDLRSEDEAF